MKLLRIGDKVVSKSRVIEAVTSMLDQRQRGRSQQEVARMFGVDRSFVSWLEKLGSVRKGKRIAVVGFPVANKDELERVCREEGVEFVLLLTDRERWAFVEQRTGFELVNELMDTLAVVRSYDVVILLGSDYRLRVMRALIDAETLAISLGPSPIRADVYLDPERLRDMIRSVKL